MTQYLTDHATHNDLLDYEDFHAALYDVVTDAETPLTVGVFGPWGSGKTSLMQMLRQQLEAKKDPDLRTVWFTAWKYDRQEALWRAFILRVIDALYPRESKPDGLPREERPILKNPNDQEQKLISLLQRLEESVYQGVDWEEIGEREINKWQFISNITKASVETGAAVTTAGTSLWLKNLMGGDDTPVDEIKKAAEAISKGSKAYHRRQLFHMEQFEATFKEAIKTMSPDKTGRLIVFVDDLDRCLPEKAIEVLEAIKLFLEVPGVVFVLGMDQGVIRRGIEARYAAFFANKEEAERDELPIRGDSYLQKIIQIPFHLPALAVEELDDFIAELKSNLSEQTRAVLARGVYPNPRQVKRVLNIWQLLRRIADRRFTEKGQEISDPLLAKTVIIQTQYPELYQLWRQYPTLVQTLETEYARRPSSDEDRLRGLRRQPLETDIESGTEPKETEPERSGGLLDPYLNNRTEYALLERLMTYPPENKDGDGTNRARFSGLSRTQVAAYVRLAGAVESDEPQPVEIPAPTLQALLSNEPVEIREAVERLQESEAEQVPTVQQQMVQVLSDASQPTASRLSAGEALAQLGDPRFHDADYFFLPKDDLWGFVEIPAGNFRMGSDPKKDENARKAEQPQHTLHLDTFYLAKYPVTVAQFQHFVAQSDHQPANGSSLQGAANHPVRFVTWYDAIAYCDWLNQVLRQAKETPPALQTLLKLGWRVTLPSEAEWEKGARGSDGRLYPWGNSFDPDKANHKETGLENSSTVGSYPNGASPFGLLDMSGNVWEWTRTIWRERFGYRYQATDGRETILAENKAPMVLRGGSAWNDANALRCASRHSSNPLVDNSEYGFRVCVSPFLLPADR